MKTIKGLVHAIFECEQCGKRWENYLTAQDNARRHAQRHGHRVRGETAFSVTYDGEK